MIENKNKLPRQYPSITPQLAEGEHPIDKNIYRLPTYAIENMLNAVYGWIEKLTPGAMVYGKPRTGKTESIFEIMKRLPGLLGKDIPIDIFDCVCCSRASSTENQFYEQLLNQLGYAISTTGTREVKLRRIIDFITQRVREANDYRFILFLDEAQLLHDKHFKWFMGIHNLLKHKDIHLIVFLVGQPELITLRESFAMSAQSQLIGRFMVSSHEFKGITTDDEMKIVLEGIDNTEFPENSGCGYTEYFLPIAYNNGLRLCNSASLFMTCFKEILKEETTIKLDDMELPMQIIPPTISYILHSLASIDDKDLVLDKYLVIEAIAYSDYVDWMKNVVQLPVSSKIPVH